MRILADENIPLIREACANLGDVRTMPGRAMTPDMVRDVDVLFVRSVTRVDAALLDGSRVQFVGTATIGTDHVDLAWLAARGIGFAAAPGSNATSVAEYIVAALLCLAERRDWRLCGKTLGVVGVGNVGSRVVVRAQALGLTILKNDPPLARRLGDTSFLPLRTVLAESDFVTVHVPLTRKEPDATWHLIDDGFLHQLRASAVVLNTSRGGVHDTAALLRRRPAGLVLDVWEGEPNISEALLRRVDLGTPHIAGYSFDGKIAGTRMIYEAACRFFGVAPQWNPAPHLPPPRPPLVLDTDQNGESALLRRAVRASYDIEADDARLRALLELPEAERGPAFDRLRKTYPVRREFAHTPVQIVGNHPQRGSLCATLRGLGFALHPGSWETE